MSAGIKFHRVSQLFSSEGHKLPHVSGPQVQKALEEINFDQDYQPKAKFNGQFDIPYLLGYDTKREDMVYRDRDFVPKFNGTDASRPLLTHETVERLLESTGWNYQQRHHVATHCENVICQVMGIDWAAYTRWTTHEWHKSYAKWKSPGGLVCPKTLDMSPYVDEDDKLVRAMRKAGAEDKGEEA